MCVVRNMALPNLIAQYLYAYDKSVDYCTAPFGAHKVSAACTRYTGLIQAGQAANAQQQQRAKTMIDVYHLTIFGVDSVSQFE